MTDHIEWRVAPGYPAYEVSNTGFIRRVKRLSLRQPARNVLLKPRALKRGHCYVNLYDGNGKVKSVYVHRLVAIAFLGPPPTPKHQVAHWDGNAMNNALENLRWATNKENSADMIRHGRSPRPKGEKNKRAKLTNTQADYVRATPQISCREWGRRLGVSHTRISAIRRGAAYK